MLNIIYCSDYPPFANNALLDYAFGCSYPGAGWVPALSRLCKHWGIHNVVSGDVAREKISRNEWNPSDCVLIDELGSHSARALIAMGCTPLLQTAFEARLYAPLFYEREKALGSPFHFRSRFGQEDNLALGNLSQRFPSYFQSDLRAQSSNSTDEKTVVYVAANKYRTARLNYSTATSPENVVRYLKHKVGILVSPVYREAVTLSLHDRRLELLDVLAQNGRLALFGGGWDNLYNLPAEWRNRLGGLSCSYFGRCINKIDTMRKYRYALCIENMVAPGYITEKLIDCMMAGVVPIYIGAPDIEKYVPPDSFIDGRQFDKPQELLDYIDELSAQRWNHIVQEGRYFLHSYEGSRYSYEGFAALIIDLIHRTF